MSPWVFPNHCSHLYWFIQTTKCPKDKIMSCLHIDLPDNWLDARDWTDGAVSQTCFIHKSLAASYNVMISHCVLAELWLLPTLTPPQQENIKPLSGYGMFSCWGVEPNTPSRLELTVLGNVVVWLKYETPNWKNCLAHNTTRACT